MSQLPKYKMHIGGEWTAAASGEWFETFDPYAGKPTRGEGQSSWRARKDSNLRPPA